MKHIPTMLLAILLLSMLLSGCDNQETRGEARITVNYEIDRKFQWSPEENRFSGIILVRDNATTRGVPLSSNSYGIMFELSPGERTTIVTKASEEGGYYNEEFAGLPFQLPHLMARQSPDTFQELFDWDVRAACEVELSPEPIDGRYYLIFSCYDVQATWLFSTSFELFHDRPIRDEQFVPFSAGKLEFEPAS